MLSNFIFFALICISSARHLHSHIHERDQEYECPFVDADGYRCLRDTDSALSQEERNPRPDIIFKRSTRAELLSEKYCCFEMECLDICGIRSDVLDNYDTRHLPKTGFKALEEHPLFFTNRDYNETTLKNWDTEKDSKMRVAWRIAMAHFHLAHKEWDENNEKLDRLNKLFA